MAKVLVIEDNPETQADLTQMFSSAAHVVDRAASVREATILIREWCYDAIIVDGNLPGHDEQLGFHAELPALISERQAGAVVAHISVHTGDEEYSRYGQSILQGGIKGRVRLITKKQAYWQESVRQFVEGALVGKRIQEQLGLVFRIAGDSVEDLSARGTLGPRSGFSFELASLLSDIRDNWHLLDESDKVRIRSVIPVEERTG